MKGPLDTSKNGGGINGQPSANTNVRAAALLGTIAVTDVAVSQEDRDLGKFSPIANEGTGGIGEDIYGPFEAGFSGSGAQQDIIRGFGCQNPQDVEVQGGIDTKLAEEIIADVCGITLPRFDGNDYISLLDQCGGHTRDYHFHEKLICLYNQSENNHSTKVGMTTPPSSEIQQRPIYGKYESEGQVLPKLDACGGHYGVTPDSNGLQIYHHHVQEKPPFVIGCYGPNATNQIVQLEECRSMYSGCSSKPQTFALKSKTIQYRLWCPCYDNNGYNAPQNGNSTNTSNAQNGIISNPSVDQNKKSDTSATLLVAIGVFAGIATSVALIVALQRQLQPQNLNNVEARQNLIDL